MKEAKIKGHYKEWPFIYVLQKKNDILAGFFVFA